MYLLYTLLDSNYSHKLFYRYSQFYTEDSFCHYNMFNHHFFDGKVRIITVIPSYCGRANSRALPFLFSQSSSRSDCGRPTIYWYLVFSICGVCVEHLEAIVLFFFLTFHCFSDKDPLSQQGPHGSASACSAVCVCVQDVGLSSRTGCPARGLLLMVFPLPSGLTLPCSLHLILQGSVPSHILQPPLPSR